MRAILLLPLAIGLLAAAPVRKDATPEAPQGRVTAPPPAPRAPPKVLDGLAGRLPPKAWGARYGIPGRGVADCIIGEDGVLRDCRVAGESPTGMGFGEVVRKTASMARVATTYADGKSDIGDHFLFVQEYRISPVNLPVELAPGARPPRDQDIIPKVLRHPITVASVGITCAVAADRTLSDCTARVASADDIQLRDAALALTQGLRARPDAAPAGVTQLRFVIRIAVAFGETDVTFKPDPVLREFPPMTPELEAAIKAGRMDILFPPDTGTPPGMVMETLQDGRRIYRPADQTEAQAHLTRLRLTDDLARLGLPILARPTPRQLDAAWPANARATGRAGDVILNCAIGKRGWLGDCVIWQEITPGFGLGAAAVTLGSSFRVNDHDAAGQDLTGLRTHLIVHLGPMNALSARPLSGVRATEVAVGLDPVALDRRGHPVDLPAYYPERAQRMDMNGEAVVLCRVGQAGSLAECLVQQVTPAGYGFDEAVMWTWHFMKIRDRADQPLPSPGSYVRFTFRFTLGE